ncbi:triose-phosphate isomerase [Alterisphingorhabdus coralli]|uniref:Triosephosphate isomerase n=1 Tax=Alterisphingorhabdus coralli TaxID=3071408 RepID=A0AA97I099_9SPHN|nr:triose-phosphate isomerase [Parasphingorhabdus sp. SCSIO 66989]WOE73950.1 triose-phosphate isomerase [Parasphingorhabdus sp. SCSIO 66989]
MRPYIIANWKMNGSFDALDEAWGIDEAAGEYRDVDVAICPPATLIAPMADELSYAKAGAQDCHQAESGAHTGCLSANMIGEVGGTLAIVGHSERRQDQAETSAIVAEKLIAAQKTGLEAILCIGEPLDVRDAGEAESYVCQQLAESLVGDIDPAMLTVAYEPIWAIGTGRVAGESDIAAMHAACRAQLVERFGDVGAGVRLLYGGSVKGENAPQILAIDDVNGALVGGASLKAETFAPIIAAAAQ